MLLQNYILLKNIIQTTVVVAVQTEMECSKKEDLVVEIDMDQVEVVCALIMVVEHSTNVHIHHRQPPQDSVTENLMIVQEMDILHIQMEQLDTQDSIKCKNLLMNTTLDLISTIYRFKLDHQDEKKI
jgi:hypothetical protein